MPKYSILETQINFNSKEKMTSNLLENVVCSALKIESYLANLER